MANLSPRSQALAYRIWGHCEPIGWNCTCGEIAEALGEDVKRVGVVAHHKGWNNRLRRSGAEETFLARHNSTGAVSSHQNRSTLQSQDFGIILDRSDE